MMMIFVLYVKDTFTLQNVSSVTGFSASNARNCCMKIAMVIICTVRKIVQAHIQTCALVSSTKLIMKQIQFTDFFVSL
jgi:hypothetical protein